MKTGIGRYYIERYGLVEGAKRMKEHGYSFCDFPLADTETEYYREGDDSFIEDARSALESAGIKVFQIHGPWRFPKDATEEDRAERFDKMTRAMKLAKHLGAEYMAVHPLMPFGICRDNPDELYRINKEYYTALARVAEGIGVTVCLENMPFVNFPMSTPSEIAAFIRDIDHPNLKMCFDTGHANCFPEPIGKSVREIGADLIRILHLHDNLGVDDTHSVPYDGIVNWAEVIEALYDVGYDGVINLECAPVSKKQYDELTDGQITARELELAKIAALFAY